MDNYTNESLHALDKKIYLPTFRRLPLAMEHGEGCYVWDVNGKKYLDTLAGIAVNNVGYSHPKVVQAVQEQAARLMHISNFFVSKPQIELAQKLTSLSGLGRVFFTNSGAESLEGAFKVARKYAHSKGRGGDIISFSNSFHGRTLATIASGKKKYQQGFEPIPMGFHQAIFNDMESVRKLVNWETGAIVIEPIQGEGGINIADRSFLQELREFCTREDIVLIFDEVQCGIGRTGHWFAKDHFKVQPDVMTLAKGLGGGIPIGAFLSSEKVSAAIDYGDHGTTFGGNPLVCASALATLEVIESEDLLAAAREKGAWFRDAVRSLENPSIKEVRGVGLMIGIEFVFEPKPLVMEMLEMGVIANATANHVLRLVPPLIITKDQLSHVMEVMARAQEKLMQNG